MRIWGIAGAVVLAGCSGAASSSSPGGNGTTTNASETAAANASAGVDAGGARGCSTSGPLAGASYDVTKSKFAFGGTPVADDAGDSVQYKGPDGVVGIATNGAELAGLDGGAAASLGDWSDDLTKSVPHAVAYWESMGAEACQIVQANRAPADGDLTYGSSGETVTLSRSVHGIVVVESVASARFVSSDQTTSEAFYWPEIPADVVAAAIAFAGQLSTPAGLAAYRAKLPANSQGDGTVHIHHSDSTSSGAFRAGVTYDVLQSASAQFSGQLASFDSNGNPVSTDWN